MHTHDIAHTRAVEHLWRALDRVVDVEPRLASHITESRSLWIMPPVWYDPGDTTGYVILARDDVIPQGVCNIALFGAAVRAVRTAPLLVEWYTVPDYGTDDPFPFVRVRGAHGMPYDCCVAMRGAMRSITAKLAAICDPARDARRVVDAINQYLVMTENDRDA